MTSADVSPMRPAVAGGAGAALLDDPSPRLVAAFNAAAARMAGLGLCNPALAVEAIGFAPWAGHWLGIVVTPWFMNLTLAPRDPAAWATLRLGEKRRYRFPAGDYDFIGAHDAIAGEYQACSLFSPVLEFEDQPTARLIAALAREALFDAANAEVPPARVANPAAAATAGETDHGAPGPLAAIDARLATPMSKRDFLRGRTAASGDVPRG